MIWEKIKEIGFKLGIKVYLVAPLAFILASRALAQSSGAQSNLTLDQAVEEGLHHSPQIQKSRAVAKEYQWKKFESLGQGFLPKISVSGTHYFQNQYEVTQVNLGAGALAFPGFYPNTQFSLEVKIPVFDGFANINEHEGSSLIERATEKELARAEFQLRKDIQLAFYQALAAAQLDAVAEENVLIMTDHLSDVKIRKRGGVATKYDALRVEVQLNEARADAIDAKDNVVLTRRKLIALLGEQNDDRVLKGELPIPEISKVGSLQFSDVPKTREDLEALNLRSQAAEKFRNAQDSWYMPRISVGGSYFIYNQQIFNNTVTDTGNYQNAYNAGIFLNWNLFDGGVAIAKSYEASYQQVEVEKVAEAAKVQVPYDFEYWKRRYLSNSDHYLSKKLDVTRSEESVRLAKEEEKAGTRTSTETLDAELDLFRSKAGAVTAQVNAAEAQIHLELVLGRSI
jgi:outer membrane protein TolC